MTAPASFTVRMDARPDCSICADGAVYKQTPAAYDAKTWLGPWAYLCRSCFVSFGTGLGEGKGQRIIVPRVPAGGE